MSGDTAAEMRFLESRPFSGGFLLGELWRTLGTSSIAYAETQFQPYDLTTELRDRGLFAFAGRRKGCGADLWWQSDPVLGGMGQRLPERGEAGRAAWRMTGEEAAPAVRMGEVEAS